MHKKTFNFKTLIFSFFLLLTLSPLSNADGLRTRVDTFPKKEMKSQNKTIARMVAKEIKSTLPQTVDKYTRLTDIYNKDTTIFYIFEINTGSKSDEAVKKEDKSRMHKAIETGVCQSSRKFLEAGINISYIYINAISKKHLFKFDISQKNCVKLIN
jgi:hypothetical protein